jgi:outer membrane receptor protein involved in Fe transport
LQLRADRFDVALRRTEEREVFATIRADEGSQWSLGAYAEVESRWTPRLRSVVALRGDRYSFDVTSDEPKNSGTASDEILSPKASLVFTPNDDTELYLSGGYGFHSNDARGTVQTVDPMTGDPVDPVDPLVSARGAEVGLRASPVEGWRSTLALWTVDLESELVFVGDAGTTEPSDPSRRFGATWTNIYRITPTIEADFDLSVVRARLRDVEEGQDRIPGAPEIVAATGVTWEPVDRGPYAALRLRQFGSYPLVEDDSERAGATSIVNLNAGWDFGELRVGVSLLNALDSDGFDIQYLYASRVPGEPVEGVEGVHFHPVEPRQIRVTASWGL